MSITEDVTLEPDHEGLYGLNAEVVARCRRCDFSASYPNYLIAAEILARRDVREHFREAHYLQERYDRLVKHV